MGFLLYGAHLGGKLVYEYGVGGSAVKQPQGHHDHHDGHDHSH